MKTFHVIPVPHGYTPEDSFAEWEAFGRLVEYRWWRPRFHWPFVKWAVIEVDE